MAAEDAERAAVVEARMGVEQVIYYVKEAAAQKNSDRLKEVADKAQEWLQDGPGSMEDATKALFDDKKKELDKALAVKEAAGGDEDQVAAFLRAKAKAKKGGR